MILATFLFFLGLIIGSAINSFLWRYQKGKTYQGRSMCPECEKTISWFDNIPLVSYVILGGKCRHCQKPISIRYPIIELLTGLAFLFLGFFSKTGIYLSHLISTLYQMGLVFKPIYLAIGILELGLALAIVTILIMIADHDLKTQEIPNGFNLAFILLSALYLIFSQIANFNLVNTFYYIIAAISAFLFFYAFVYFSHETWMGGGDAKMAFGMGLLLGPAGTFLAILIASVTGSIYGISTLLIQKLNKNNLKKSKNINSKINQKSQVKNQKSRHEVPFGPFLALGTYVCMVFGPQIIDWYVRIVLGI